MPLETGDDYYNYYSSMMPWGNQGTGTTAPGTGITQLATPTIKYPPQYGGGDPTTTKNFDVTQWGIDMSKAPPGMEKVTASWQPSTVQGFQTGNQPWKTAQGKNIQHAGIGSDVYPSFMGALLDKVGPQKFQGHRVGDIKGTFSEGIPEEGIWAAMMGKTQKDKQKVINQQIMQQQIREAEIAERQRATAAAQVRQNIATYGSGDRPSTGMNVAGGGKGQSPTGGDVAGTPFSRGGILGAF